MILAIDWSMFKTIGKYALIVLGILLLVYLLAELTPHIARFIDNKILKPERVSKKGIYDFEKDELKSIYDVQKKTENGDVKDNGEQQ